MLSRRGLSFRFPEVKASIVILISVCLTKISSQSAASLSPHQFECHYNYAVLSEKTGDLQVCLIMSSLPLFLLLPRTVVITLSLGSTSHNSHMLVSGLSPPPPPDQLHACPAEPCQLPQPRGQQGSPRPALNSLPDLVNNKRSSVNCKLAV